MNLFFPVIERSHWWEYLRLSLLGSLIAGGYGIIHDQITYTLSAEYYTEVKFVQFAYADFGMGPRVFAGTVGILATWWVGLIVGWFLARLAVPRLPAEQVRSLVYRGFGLVFGCGLAGGLSGWGLGKIQASAGVPQAWQPMLRQLDVERPLEFIVVANIHNFGYLGAFIGLVVAGLRIVRAQGTKGANGGIL